jgi:hypothetical protein
MYLTEVPSVYWVLFIVTFILQDLNSKLRMNLDVKAKQHFSYYKNENNQGKTKIIKLVFTKW